MIFPSLVIENIIQENDKTRLDATRSYTTNNETITMVEISPDNGTTFYDVTNDLFLDWQFSAAGAQSVVVRITGDISGAISFTKGCLVVTEAEDNLFSNDGQLVDHEDDILSYVRSGRNSYIDKHRLAQQIILNELDKAQIWKDDGSRYVATDIVDIQEFKEWSKYLTLRLVYESISNATDDVFSQKASKYRQEETDSKKRACLRLDSNGDGTNDKTEQIDLVSGDLVYKW